MASELWIPLHVPSGVTSTTFTLISSSGVCVDPTTLGRLGSRVRVQLGALLAPAASQSLTIRLGYQHTDERITPFPETSILLACPVTAFTRKRTSPFVDVSPFSRLSEPFVLRLEGRVSGGTGTVLAAMVVVRVEG